VKEGLRNGCWGMDAPVWRSALKGRSTDYDKLNSPTPTNAPPSEEKLLQ